VPTRAELSTATSHVVVGVLGAAWVLGVTGLAGPVLLAVALGCATVVVAWGWAGTLGLPTPRGTVGVLLVGGAAVLLSVALRQESPWLTWLPAALAVSMIAAFLHQLLRRDGRPRVTESVSSVVLGLAVLTSAVFLVPLARTDAGSALIIAAVGAAAVSAVTDLLGRSPRLRPWTPPLALAAGGALGALVAALAGQPWVPLLLVGVACGGVSHAVRAVFAVLPTLAHARPRLVAALSSVLVVGVVPYVVASALLAAALPV
jgi:hypothetical protein